LKVENQKLLERIKSLELKVENFENALKNSIEESWKRENSCRHFSLG